MSGWGCPNELKGICQRVEGRPCDPGMKGCVLFGRFVFSTPEKNISRHTRDAADRNGSTPARHVRRPAARQAARALILVLRRH